jgi:hypothetical protein
VFTPIAAFAGVKVTVTVQLAPAANVEPQVFPVTENGSLRFAPMLLIVIVDVPKLVNVNVLLTGLSLSYQLPKFVDAGENAAGSKPSTVT